MRVLLTVDSLDPVHGGTSRTVPALARALRERGVDARVHAWEQDGRPRTRPDLVHDHGIWLPTNHRSARFAARARVPRVVSVHGMLEPWAVGHHRWKKRLVWRLYQRRDLELARAIHVTSPAEARSVRATGLATDLAVVPNGIDVPDPLPDRHRGGRRRALFLSRIHPKKGLPMLLDAWAAVRPEGWELVLAGPDDRGHRAELERKVQVAGLEGEVHFPGEVSDSEKWPLYRSADLFVLPTHSENFGLVVAEAMAAGLPVLTTRGAPWKELETHDCGWWVETSTAAIAAALGEAIALSDAGRQAMGERGQARVQGRYTWPRVARKMEDVYAWVLGGGARPEFLTVDTNGDVHA